MSNPLIKAEDAIAVIESGVADKHEVLQALEFVRKVGEIYRAMKYRVDQAAIGWIDQNGEIEEGAKRWYVGTVTKRTCKDVPETIRTILESEGVDGLCSALSSSCFRPATAMEMLGEQAGRLWTIETVPDLKTGAPRKALKGVPIGLPEGDEQSDL